VACMRMRGAAVLCAVAALAAGCPGVTAAVPAAAELRVLNVAVVAGVMRQLLGGLRVRRYAGASGEPVMMPLWHFLIAPPAGASRERRSREMRNTWVRSAHTAWGRAMRTTWS
jgi:NAD(P)H-hydrate repair Nnr-like enzyme with NAD(P)H-hydrate dehydratase domain